MVCALAFLSFSIVAWFELGRIGRLMPKGKKPKSVSVLVIIVVGLGVWWVHDMQAVLMPKLLHGFSHPEHASVAFTVDGAGGRRRYDCRTMDVVTKEYGAATVCQPSDLRDRLRRGATGAFGGAKSIYGFWIETMFLDEPKP